MAAGYRAWTAYISQQVEILPDARRQLVRAVCEIYEKSEAQVERAVKHHQKAAEQSKLLKGN